MADELGRLEQNSKRVKQKADEDKYFLFLVNSKPTALFFRSGCFYEPMRKAGATARQNLIKCSSSKVGS